MKFNETGSLTGAETLDGKLEIVQQLLQELIFRVDLLLYHIEKRLLSDVLAFDVLIQVLT